MAKADKPEKKDKKEKKDKNNNKKQRHFWKDFKAELKKVIWPTRKQVINNTIIVIAIVLLVTAIVFVLDLAFEALNTYGIDNLKTVVKEISEEAESEDTETDETADSSEETSEDESTSEAEETSDEAEVEDATE